MPSVIHEIDPFADTVIILKNPCKDFAPWEGTIALAETETTAPEEEEGDSVDSDSRRLEDDDLVTAHESEPQSTEPISEIKEPMDDEIHYLVSSRHLMLASPCFRRALTGQRFSEAVKDPIDGRYHIQASDWDEQALLILLNVFHIRTRQVPATVSLEMLAKIAVLVDYYELKNAEVIERDVNNWIDGVRRDNAIPSLYCRDVLLWICISEVFCLKEEFKKATSVAIKTCERQIENLELPISEGIISKIERSRCNAIADFILRLDNLLEIYRDPNYSCPHGEAYSFQCGIFLYGALMKQMERCGYLPSRPEAPFNGVSLKKIISIDERLETLRWWSKGGHHKVTTHPCSLRSVLDELIRAVMEKVTELDFEEFKEDN